MSLQAPHCSCDDGLVSSFGPCPVHGQKSTKRELEMYREGAQRNKETLVENLMLIRKTALELEREDALRGVVILCDAMLAEARGDRIRIPGVSMLCATHWYGDARSPCQHAEDDQHKPPGIWEAEIVVDHQANIVSCAPSVCPTCGVMGLPSPPDQPALLGALDGIPR